MSEPLVIRRVRTQEPVTPVAGTQILLCTHCHKPLAYSADGKLKLAVKSRVLAFVDGVAEMRCPHCGKDTPLPNIRLTIQ